MSTKNLTDVSDEQLQAELERREKEKKTSALPKPLAKPDYSRLESMVKDGIRQLDEEGREPKDFDHYVFEAAMEAVYGKSIWDWYNKCL